MSHDYTPKNYTPVKTLFAALCARLNLSQQDVAELVPCRLDTVKKWQQGKMIPPKEIFAHLYNLEIAIRETASSLAKSVEEYLDENGTLVLNVPRGFASMHGPVDSSTLIHAIRPLYAEISLQLLPYHTVEIQTVDAHYSFMDMGQDIALFEVLDLFQTTYDADSYWNVTRPELEALLEDPNHTAMALESWKHFQIQISNFENMVFNTVYTADVSTPTNDTPPFTWEKAIGITLEWAAPDGQTHNLDVTYPLNTDEISQASSVDLIERRTINDGKCLIKVHGNTFSSIEELQAKQDLDIIKLLNEKFGTVTNFIKAVKTHPNYQPDWA